MNHKIGSKDERNPFLQNYDVNFNHEDEFLNICNPNKNQTKKQFLGFMQKTIVEKPESISQHLNVFGKQNLIKYYTYDADNSYGMRRYTNRNKS